MLLNFAWLIAAFALAVALYCIVSLMYITAMEDPLLLTLVVGILAVAWAIFYLVDHYK